MIKGRGVRRSVVIAVLALAALTVSAVGAAAAQAEGPFWYTGKTSEGLTKLTGSSTVLGSLGETKFENGKEVGKTATGFLLSPPEHYNEFQIYATGAEFKETVIKNTAPSGVISGRIKLTGVTVALANCQVGEYPTIGTVVSQPIWEVPTTINGKKYLEITSPSGPSGLMFAVEIGGASCGVSTSLDYRGALVAEDSSLYESGISHTLRFSKLEQGESGKIALAMAGGAFAEGSLVEHLSEPMYWALK